MGAGASTHGIRTADALDALPPEARSKLASTLRFRQRGWKSIDFDHFGLALHEFMCEIGSLDTLWLLDIGTADSTVVLCGLVHRDSESYQIFYLKDCPSFTELPPEVSTLTGLQELLLCNARVTGLPDLSDLTSLRALNLYNCRTITALPDLSTLPCLEEINLIGCDSLPMQGAEATGGARMLDSR